MLGREMLGLEMLGRGTTTFAARTLGLGLGLIAAVLATGCVNLRPDGFVELPSSDDVSLFVAADDSKLLVREFEVPEEANVEFWTTAIQREFEERRGYRDPDVKVRERGSVLTYTATVEGLEYRYRLYFEECGAGRVRVAEFVALSDDFDEHVKAVDAVYFQR